MKAAQSQYSESEAAQKLGIPVDELRRVIHRHIFSPNDEAVGEALATFNASDLVLLRILMTSAPSH
jgi:hypothetical protein